GRVAPVWEHWQRRNRYYHKAMATLIGGMIPPGAEVLELGAGAGDLLASLKPARGMGLNFTDALTERAREKHPEFEFATIEVDSVQMPRAMQSQYVVMNNIPVKAYASWDIWRTLRPTTTGQPLLIVT